MNIRSISVIAVFLFTGLLIGCPGDGGDNRDPAGTDHISGQEPPDEEQITGPLTPPREAEALSVPGLTYVSPVSPGNVTVCVPSELRSPPEAPDLVFTYPAPAPARFPGVFHESMYYQADDGGTVTALNLPGGSAIWEKLMEGSPAGPPVILADMLLLSRTDGIVNAFSLDSGELLWSSDLEFPLTAAPVYAGGVIVAAGVSGVTALSPFDGEVLWQGADTSYAADDLLKVSEELVLLSGTPVLSALNPSAGEILWQMETGTETAISCAVLDSGEIYGKAENQVERISDTEEEQPALYYTYADHDAPLRSDGTRLIMRLKGGGHLSVLPGTDSDVWEWYPSEPVSSNILVSGDFLAAGSEDRSIYLLTKNTGDAVVRWETDFVPRALSFWNGILIVSDSAGNVSGYSLDQSGN